MINIQSLLEKAELSPTASKVYLALLDLGKSSADTIAKKVGTYKANVYDALDRLMEDGFASPVYEGQKRLFIPTSPDKLPTLIEQAKAKKEEYYDELKKEINEVLPSLMAKYNSKKEKNLFEIYGGKNGYRAMILDILLEKPRLWQGFGNLQVQEFFPYDFPKWFKKVNIKLFSTKTEDFEKRLKEARKLTNVEIKYLPEELAMPVVWTIFGENLLILIYAPEIIALRIKSRQVVETFSNQFNYLWKKK